MVTFLLNISSFSSIAINVSSFAVCLGVLFSVLFKKIILMNFTRDRSVEVMVILEIEPS